MRTLFCVAIAAPLLLVACQSDFSCTEQSDCPSGFMCLKDSSNTGHCFSDSNLFIYDSGEEEPDAGDAGSNPGPDAGDAGHDAGPDAGDAGPDAGDAGPPAPSFCGSVGATCDAGCCNNLTCQAGVCQPPPPVCAGYAEPCGSGVACCGADGGILSCTPLNDAGLALCIAGLAGSPCANNSQCGAPTSVCVDGGPTNGTFCDYPQTRNTCTSAATCALGDDCSAAALAIYNTRQDTSMNDPCSSAGLSCYAIGETETAFIAVCIQPQVAHPPGFPDPDGAPFDASVCNSATASCVPDNTGAPRTAVVCGNYFMESVGFLAGNEHCLDQCTVDDDCSNIAEQCVGNVCVPNYCYAAGTVMLNNGMTPTLASFLSPASVAAGGSAVSADPTVLFNPCVDAGEPTACLPQYDQVTNASTGWCVRVGAADAGGWGSPCDPQPYRNNPAGYCAPGTFCDKGTCMPWCDLGTTAFIQCPGNTTCSRLPSGTVLNSTSAGVTNALGVCTQPCNPYLGASGNTCDGFPIATGQPHAVCKFSESQNDVAPPPGMCVAAVDQPLALGQACSPFGWLDPCVSGAECVETTSDGGPPYLCAQLCDPSPSSPAVNAPACPTPTTCQPFLTNACEGYCAHEGACQ